MYLRKTASALCALALVFGAAAPVTGGVFGTDTAITASAADIVKSGYCGKENENEGKNVTWTLDSEGTLTISGKGDMTSYDNSVDLDNSKNSSPWHNINGIKQIKIHNGVTSIGDDAFSDCTNVESITIPNSVTNIGNWAFWNCTSLASVTIPDSVTSIGLFAFNSPKITIYGYPNTAAEKYANDNGFNFISLDEPPVIIGDIDGNGIIEVDDLMLMQKKVAGWDISKTTYNEKAADIDKDGNVDVDDLVILQKIVAGWKV